MPGGAALRVAERLLLNRQCLSTRRRHRTAPPSAAERTMPTGTGPLTRPWGVAALLVVVVVAFAQCWPLSGHQKVISTTSTTPAPPVGSQGISAVAYVVDLTVEDTASSFDIATVITVEATEAVDVIVLNAKQLDVAKKVVVDGEDKNGVSVRVPVSDVVFHEDREEVEILLGKKLTVGDTYNVSVTATGVLGVPSGEGFIKATYDSGKSWLAAIRSSPTSARMVFPCVDQAGEEADVTLRVWRPATHTAISNAPVINSVVISGGLTVSDTFATIRLAPHQVGLVVAPLKRQSADGDAVVLWGREQAAAATQEDARKYVSTVNALVENLSQVPLAESPLSVVALPGVTNAAAAPGIVALSEEAVLALHAAAPSSTHRDALLRLAEAAAQPAVRGATRPASWGDAWALQGLAAHLRHRLADQAAAGWRLVDQQMALQLQDVLEEGAKSTDVPLTPADGDQLGAASAGKGAALIRMMEYALNPKVFDSAVQTFYSRSAGKAVSVDDLYDAFSDAAYNGDSGLDDGVTVVNVWSSWASKAGYPVVTVMRDYENNAITVSQRKFSWASISDRGALGAEDANSEWWVPLSYTYALEQQNDGERLLSPRDWLVPGENDMLLDPIPHLSSDDWVYFNLDQAAPYRVNYDTFNWRMLSRELLGVQFDKTLPAASRAHLLGDALALARAGELDYALALDLAVYLRREDDLLPWQVARRSFTFLEDRLQGDALDWLHQLEALLLKDVYLDAQFGMGGAPEGQNPDVRLLRELAVTWACEAGLQQCLEHADQLYSEWSSGGQAPQADMVEAVLCRAVASRGDDALSFVLTALADDTLAGGQRRSYVRAAACGSTEHLLRRAVSEALVASGPFTSSEVAELLEAVTARKPHGWAVVTDFLEKDSTGIQQRTGNEGELERLSLLLASKTTSQSQLDELLRAVAASQGSEDSTLAATIRNEVAVNLAWANLNADLVADWIRVYLNLPPAPTTPAVVPTTATAPTTTTRPTTARPSPPTTPTSTSTTPRGAGSAPVPGFVMWIVSLLAVAAAAPRQRFALLRV